MFTNVVAKHQDEDAVVGEPPLFFDLRRITTVHQVHLLRVAARGCAWLRVAARAEFQTRMHLTMTQQILAPTSAKKVLLGSASDEVASNRERLAKALSYAMSYSKTKCWKQMETGRLLEIRTIAQLDSGWQGASSTMCQ